MMENKLGKGMGSFAAGLLFLGLSYYSGLWVYAALISFYIGTKQYWTFKKRERD